MATQLGALNHNILQLGQLKLSLGNDANTLQGARTSGEVRGFSAGEVEEYITAINQASAKIDEARAALEDLVQRFGRMQESGA
jgi:hypothetical protein